MSKEIAGVGLAKVFNEIREANRIRKKANPDHFYPKLLIYKAKRNSLYLFIPLMIVVVAVVLFYDHQALKGWQESFLSILPFCLLLLCLPLSEEWDYKPWQSGCRQMERHTRE